MSCAAAFRRHDAASRQSEQARRTRLIYDACNSCRNCEIPLNWLRASRRGLGRNDDVDVDGLQDTEISLTRTFSSIDFSTVSQNDNTVNQHKTMVNEGDGWGGEGDSLLLAMTPTFSTMTPVLR